MTILTSDIIVSKSMAGVAAPVVGSRVVAAVLAAHSGQVATGAAPV